MEIRDKVQKAFREFLKRDVHLLKVKANERSITHRFATYVQDQFPRFNVDCEYNRKEFEPKRLDSFRKSVSSDDVKGVTVFPDVIVHLRGTTNNHLVIEAKLSSNHHECGNSDACRCDCCKLRAYKTDLGYAHAFYIVFPVEDELAGFSDAKLSDYVKEIE